MNNNQNPENIYSAASEESKKRKKKIYMEIIIIAAVLILAAAIAATIVIVRNKNKPEEDTSEPILQQELTAEESGDETQKSEDVLVAMSASDDIDVTFEHVTREFIEDFQTHQETTSSVLATKEETVPITSSVVSTTEKKTQESTTRYYETTTVKSESDVDKDQDIVELIQAFFDCSFYMDGTMMAGGSTSPIEMAMAGKDVQVYSEMDGIDVAIMNLGGKLYIMNPEKKTYTEIDAAFKKMMNIDEDSLTFEFTKIKFDSDSPSAVKKVRYNGRDGVCYTYENSTNGIEFVAVDGEIVQIVMFDNGGVNTILTLDEFSDRIPSDMLTFKGYSKKNMLSFISEMM